jgi:hypothetical protein
LFEPYGNQRSPIANQQGITNHRSAINNAHQVRLKPDATIALWGR